MMMIDMNTRFTADLEDPRLMRLLKLEAQECSLSMKDVIVRALEQYFSDRLETKALLKISEAVFEEWDDPRDSDYDKL